MLAKFVIIFLLCLPLISWAGQLIDFETALKNQAEIDAKNKPSHTTLPQAPIYNNIVSFTPKDKNGDTALHLASRNGNLKIMKKILDKGTIDINIINKNEQTALQVALDWGNIKAASLLIDYNANVDITDSVGDTILHLAAKIGDIEIIKNLLDMENIDINATNASGRTALQVAIEHRQKKASLLLINHNANVNFTNRNGDTTLHLASRNRNLKIIRKILDIHIIDINAINASGRTALHEAILYRQEEVALLLMDYNPDVNATNKDGDTTLHLVARNGNLKIMQKLIDLKIDIKAKNKLNQTALRLANLYGHKKAASLLKKQESKLVPHQNSDCKIVFLNINP